MRQGRHDIAQNGAPVSARTPASSWASATRARALLAAHGTHRVLVALDTDEYVRRCQMESAADSFMDIRGSTCCVLPNNPVNGGGGLGQDLHSSRSHVTELGEGACTSAQNFGRTYRRGF
jgi:hypothetical protein